MEPRLSDGRRPKRAAAACDFCRRKKLKCDTGEPTCQNCKNHGQECLYLQLAKKPRPSNERIAHLEQENRRLRTDSEQLRLQLQTQLEKVKGGDQNSHTQNASPRHSETNTYSSTLGLSPMISTPAVGRSTSFVEAPERPQSRTDEISFRSDTQSRDESLRYHGPTSVMYDETELASPSRPRIITDQNLTTEWAKCSLLAAAAKQRQSEAINFASGKLDFDGVEPQLGMDLLSIHWSRQNYTGHIVYRPAFMRDMACKGPYFSKLLLNTIYFGASRHSKRLEVRRDPNDIETAGWMYRQRAVKLLRETFDKSHITTIQALLILASSLFSRCHERSTSWLYAGNAFNMIIDLGLHVGNSTVSTVTLQSAEDLEIRRRVFWGAFVLDKIQCLYQGRPASLREADSCVSMTFLDDFEELEQFNPITYSETESHLGTPLHNTSVLLEFCRLSVIMDKIVSSLYAVKTRTRNQEEIFRESRFLHVDIDNWYKTLPQHLALNPLGRNDPTPLPHVLSLLALCKVLLILIYRPLVSDSRFGSNSPSIVLESFRICASAANEITSILSIYGKAYNMRSAPYLISYATYVSANIHIRIAAQRGPGSDASASLRDCLDALAEQATLYSAAQSAQQVIDTLMRRLGLVTRDREAEAYSYGLSAQPSTHHSPLMASTSHTLSDEMRRETSLNLSTATAFATEFDLPELDIDAVVHSFMLEQEMAQQSSFFRQNSSPWDLSSNMLLPGQIFALAPSTPEIGAMTKQFGNGVGSDGANDIGSGNGSLCPPSWRTASYFDI